MASTEVRSNRSNRADSSRLLIGGYADTDLDRAQHPMQSVHVDQASQDPLIVLSVAHRLLAGLVTASETASSELVTHLPLRSDRPTIACRGSDQCRQHRANALEVPEVRRFGFP